MPWQALKSISAVRLGNLFEIPADSIHRHTPRVLDGAERVCADLEAVRARRQAGR